MVCRNCGNEMRDDAKFCPSCGAVNGAAPGAAYAGPEAPAGGGRKKGLIIGGAVAVVAVVAAAAVALSGMLASPKQRVDAAVAKSAAAYARAWESMDLPELTQLQKSKSVSQRMSVQVTGLNTRNVGYDLSPLEGLGLRMSTGLDGRARRLGVQLSAFWDDQDIISVQLAAEDAQLYLASPQITGGTFYGVNTETLGADLKALTGDSSAEQVSFNLFDMVDIALSGAEEQEQALQSLKQAGGELLQAAQVDRPKARTISANGNELKTKSYQVTLPQQALEDYSDVLAQAMLARSGAFRDVYEQMLQSTGLPREAIDEIMGELDMDEMYGQLAGGLKQAVRELGDLTLEVCLYDGYVAAVMYEGENAGESLALYLGCGGEYVDWLRLEAVSDGEKITVESSGDHGGKKGAFTDETTIQGSFPAVTSKFRYEPKGAGDNLSWELGLSGYGSLDMEGSLTAGRDSLTLELKDMSVKVMGVEMASLALDYYVGPYDGQSAAAVEGSLITGMSMLELMTLAGQLESNAQSWLEQTQALFVSRLPEELLWALMYGGF